MKGLFQFPKNLPFLKESLTSVGWRAVSALAVGKIIAVGFGPAGTALFGQAMNLYGTLNNLPADALARAMVREGNAARASGEEKGAETAAFSSMLLLLAIYLLLAVACWLISRFTAWFNPFPAEAGLTVFLSAFALLGFGSFSASWFLIWGKTRLQALSASLMSLGGLAGLFLAYALKLNFFDCLLAFFLGQAAGSLGLLLWKMPELPFFFAGRFWSLITAGRLFRFALALAGSGLASLLMQYILVQWAMEEFGTDAAGRWMAMNRISDVFNIPILAVANSILLPVLTGLVPNPEELKKFLQPIFRQSMLWLAPGFLMLWLLYPWLLQLLFSKEFHAGSGLLPWQLAGDYFRSSTCVFAVLMLARGHTRFYFLLESASAVFMLLLCLVLNPELGFSALFVSHAVRYFLYWLAIVLKYRQVFF